VIPVGSQVIHVHNKNLTGTVIPAGRIADGRVNVRWKDGREFHTSEQFLLVVEEAVVKNKG